MRKPKKDNAAKNIGKRNMLLKINVYLNKENNFLWVFSFPLAASNTAIDEDPKESSPKKPRSELNNALYSKGLGRNSAPIKSLVA